MIDFKVELARTKMEVNMLKQIEPPQPMSGVVMIVIV